MTQVNPIEKLADVIERVEKLEEKLHRHEIDFGLTLENLKANQKLYESRHKTYGETRNIILDLLSKVALENNGRIEALQNACIGYGEMFANLQKQIKVLQDWKLFRDK